MKTLIAIAAALLVTGCKSKEKPASSTGTGPEPSAAAPALLPIGMTDPFARLSGEAAKSLNKGYKALKAKKNDEAIPAFRAVADAAPDYVAARFQIVRAHAMAGSFADATKEFEELLARDYVGHAKALDAKKEFAALRASPEWAKIEELKARYRAAYATGFDRGFTFVARTRTAGEPKADAAGDTSLDSKQEVFHFDPETKKFRRLSESGGHVFAIAPAPDGKALSVLVATKVRVEGSADFFVDPQLGTIDLSSLEMTGPFPAKGRFEDALLGYENGAPRFGLFDAGTHQPEWWAFDTAKTALTKLAAPPSVDGVLTRASPRRVLRMTGKTPDGVELSDGASQFKVAGAPVVAARAVEPASLEWSPGKNKLTYAGKIDACKILKGESKDKNELFVYDTAKKSAQRVASAVSLFESLWLDDDRLIYEGGVGKDGQLHLYTFSSHADAPLGTRFGAGLYGVPTLSCQAAAAEPATEEPEAPAAE